MNISGIRTGAGFYDYNSIKINEVRSQQIQEAIAEMEQRLQESRQYIGQPKEQLEVEFSGKNDL